MEKNEDNYSESFTKPNKKRSGDESSENSEAELLIYNRLKTEVSVNENMTYEVKQAWQKELPKLRSQELSRQRSQRYRDNKRADHLTNVDIHQAIQTELAKLRSKELARQRSQKYRENKRADRLNNVDVHQARQRELAKLRKMRYLERQKNLEQDKTNCPAVARSKELSRQRSKRYRDNKRAARLNKVDTPTNIEKPSVKRSMPASSFSIPSDIGPINKSGVKTFLQNHQGNSTLHIESKQNSSLSTDSYVAKSESLVPGGVDISTFDCTGLTGFPVNRLKSCENADVLSGLSVSLNNPLANHLHTLCKTSNEMSPVDVEEVCPSNISKDNSRLRSNNKCKKQVRVKSKKNKLNHKYQGSLPLRTDEHASETLPQLKVDQNKSAVSETDESNNTTRGSFCRVCYVECGSLELLQEHIERNELMICRVCTAEFNSHKELETHFFTHKKYNCKICQERFSDKKSLLDHRKTSVSCSYQEECKACGKQFFSKKYLDRHNLIFHNKSGGLFKCVVCGNGFVLLEKLNHHLQTCHNAYVKVECSTCQKWYLGPEKLKMHVKAAHLDCNKERDAVCSICEKRFSNVQNLKQHMETHDATDCLCDICGKSIKGKSAMKRHMQYEHSRSGTFVCKSCNEQFDMEVKLMRHRKKVHSKRAIPLPVFCEMCGKEYKSKAILKNHRLTHFDEKPFECEICGASFKQQSTLNTHRRVHNSEGKFRCNNCEMTFKWKHVYARHAKKCVGEG
ncbi:hypothetical protein J6590_066907 [Homalodisca vitripennis]|nr:hypothetical protein J6590_066907 [Homalodisca vitripennis]